MSESRLEMLYLFVVSPMEVDSFFIFGYFTIILLQQFTDVNQKKNIQMVYVDEGQVHPRHNDLQVAY